MSYQSHLSLGGTSGDDPSAHPRGAKPAETIGWPDGGSAGRLRGADVEVDARKAGRVALALVLVTLLVLGVVFTIAGIRKNDQIQELRAHAVPIDVTVTSCVGLLGGSGTNFVGYSCTGAYTLAGKRYSELVPGSVSHARGAVIHAVVVPSDPALISTAALVSTERASWAVFVLPMVFFTIVALASAFSLRAIWSRRQRGRTTEIQAALASC